MKIWRMQARQKGIGRKEISIYGFAGALFGFASGGE
jgi:hypothetical protein